MEQYVGLDVSLKMTAICIVDRTGKIKREGVVASDPEAIAAFVRLHAPHVARIGLETGATSTWLWTELNKMGLPVICIDARHAKAALKMQINKSDRNDAVGIARIMQCGWYKEVRVKGLDSHAIKALLVSRALLVKSKRDLENQIRGLLKNFGLVIGRAKMNVFLMRAVELIEARPELAAAVEPLLKVREAVEKQIADLDRKVMRLARNDVQVRRFMTAPGIENSQGQYPEIARVVARLRMSGTYLLASAINRACIPTYQCTRRCRRLLAARQTVAATSLARK
jgi:transposase